MNVIIVKKNGESYESPIENLEIIKRLVEYQDIIYPDYATEEDKEEVTSKPVVIKGKGKK
jgi:hypothetical protein